MYAVVKTGGKQYRVQENSLIRAEKIEGKKGDIIKLDQVLMVSDQGALKVGAPLVSSAFVEAEVIDQIKSDKIKIFKKKRRQNYRRTKGHRQMLTILKVRGISPDGKAPQKQTKAAKAKAETAENGKTGE